MRFCQTDGTPLLADEPLDPFKTMVARPSDLAAATPLPAEPERPIPPPKDEDAVLEIPADDPNKTMLASEDEIRREMDSHDAKNEQVIEIPPLVEAPAPPKFNEPEIAPPSFGSAPPSPYATPGEASSPFAPTTPPIPSPFSERPSNPFDEPKSPPSFADPEPISHSGPPSNPFDMPKGSGSMEPAAWTPPPAPDASWENQQIGQNTPFQPPMGGTGNQNQTMAVVSLVLGIMSVVFCQITGPVAIVLGFLARRKATERPNEYGGAGLALAGMITGAIGTLLLVLVILYFIFVVGFVASQSF